MVEERSGMDSDSDDDGDRSGGLVARTSVVEEGRHMHHCQWGGAGRSEPCVCDGGDLLAPEWHGSGEALGFGGLMSATAVAQGRQLRGLLRLLAGDSATVLVRAVDGPPARSSLRPWLLKAVVPKDAAAILNAASVRNQDSSAGALVARGCSRCIWTPRLVLTHHRLSRGTHAAVCQR